MGMSQKTCLVIVKKFRALVELGPEHIAGFSSYLYRSGAAIAIVAHHRYGVVHHLVTCFMLFRRFIESGVK